MSILEDIILDEISKIDKQLDYLFEDYQEGIIEAKVYTEACHRLVEIKRPLERCLIRYDCNKYGDQRGL